MDLMQNAVDPKLELEGATVKLDDKTTLKIARFNNPEYLKLQQKLSAPFQRKGGREDMSTREADIILNRVMSRCILMGWEGLFIDGVEVEYSPAKAFEILSDRRFRQFKEDVLWESQRLEHFRLERAEDDVKNLKGPSSIVSDGPQTNGNGSNT